MILDKENEMPDPEKIAKILDAVADKIPALIKALRDTVYSKEAGEHFGEAVGAFYHELVEQGIPEEQALEMAKGYMISLRDLVGRSMEVGEERRGAHRHHGG